MADRRVVIIGSGPAGLTAALYCARANLAPLLVEGLEAGGQLMLTTMVENYPGFRKGIQGPDLMAEMREQAAHFGSEIVQGDVTAVDLKNRPFGLQLADGRTITTDALIIATGASARWLDIGSDRKLSGRGVSTCATCDGYFFKEKPIAVVGGGDSAMEEAIYLSRLASKVTVIHRRDSLRASKIMQEKAFKNPKIDFLWNSEIAEVKDVSRGEVTGLVIRNLMTDKLHDLSVDGVFIAIGHTPNTALFQGQIELDTAGYIVTSSGTRTSVSRRLRRGRRAGPRLPSGCDGRGHRMHGGAGRGTLYRRTSRGAGAHRHRGTGRSADIQRASVTGPPNLKGGHTFRSVVGGPAEAGHHDRLVDPPAADHDVIVIKDHGLTWRNGHLRFVEHDFGSSAVERANATACWSVPIPDL